MKLSGKIKLSGDKSISHRALMIASISKGISRISNLCGGLDVQSTINCLNSCGANIVRDGQDYLVSSDMLSNPSKPLNCGNSGTTMRLMTGLLAGQGVEAVLYGDDSLSQRPMDRIVAPLKKMGGNLEYKNNKIFLKKSQILGGEILNLTSSAQVKSCIILASLSAQNQTILTESYDTRDHTEKMISYYSPNSISVNGNKIKVNPSKFTLSDIRIPGDVSNASFLIAYACLNKGSHFMFENILINKRRIGFINTLKKMGADISIADKKIKYGEVVGNIYVKYSSILKNISISYLDVKDMIDEVPILSVVASLSSGTMEIKGISELKLKESNRVLAIVKNLKSMGCDAREANDGITIRGCNKLYNTNINTFSDHRIAMAFHIASLFSKGVSSLDDYTCIEVSFPDFFNKLSEMRC
ncbi:MAG: 3-phosphoshikimate 1-carboxyvinyltransferase [Pelagibacteraceae bacterium TMED237]|nr:3-phosphoshikimate 1-carboxyvinyltransferase [Candidatus Neomarinimicrobiota bacterium]OUW96313.1 MAG: 3-phosphoshikimate 1-carboxyvinyltransferase [Pelagibacteraceae bacterium TMED237]|tara:strand:+ start:6118 stop:7359 length:1242 start_codon:yes stop_codon:yes gene_type:complete